MHDTVLCVSQTSAPAPPRAIFAHIFMVSFFFVYLNKKLTTATTGAQTKHSEGAESEK